MSTFAYINLPDTTNIMASEQDKFCICCLDRNKNFLISLTCEHASILERLTDITILRVDFGPPLICNECHTVLVNIKAFKEQVETNNSLLQVSPNRPVKSKTLNLREIEIFDNNTAVAVKKEEVEIKYEPIIEEANCINKDNSDTNDNSNDYESDIPLPQLSFVQKKQQKKKKIEHKMRSKKSKEKKYGGFSILKVNYYNNDNKLEMPLLKKNTTIRLKKRKAEVSKGTKTEIASALTSSTHDDKTRRHHKFNKYAGHIKKLTLTEEDMLEERRRYSMSQAYAKFKYKCNLCFIGFDIEKSYNGHNESKHEKVGGFICKVCQMVFRTQGVHNAHLSKHYTRYECEACGKRANNLDTVIDHYNDSHEVIAPRNLACEQCGYTTESRSKFRYHLLKQHNESNARPKCTVCDREFRYQSYLYKHMRTIHNETRFLYRCNLCDKGYKTQLGLKLHKEGEHSNAQAEKAHYCTLCQTSYRNDAILRRHYRTSLKHRGPDEEVFHCDKCSSSFRVKRYLLEHIRTIHREKGGHQCDLCDKKFKTKRTLFCHKQRVHENKQAPQDKICDQCGRAYSTTASLQSHMRLHTGERYTCKDCSATFSQKSSLYTHKTMVHGLKIKSRKK